MKVSKNGKVKLDKGEIRIGNFFVRDEGDSQHIRIVDLNSCFTIRVWKNMPLGIWLDNMLSKGESGHESIHVWIAVMWSVLSVAPDDEFVRSLHGSAMGNLERHPDWYRAGGGDEKKDADALEEVKGVMEIEGAVKESMEKHED